MKEIIPVAVIVGCGEQGATWAAEKSGPKQTVIGLDIVQPKGKDVSFISGDVFNMPFASGSINKIYADFIVNGLADEKIYIPKIRENPDILDTDNFPPLVRHWYVEKLERSHNSVKSNIGEINALLKTAALRELWRILAVDGSIEILDFEHNIEWVKESRHRIIQDRPLLLRPALELKEIISEDFKRSFTLGKFFKTRPIQKISFTKFSPQDSI